MAFTVAVSSYLKYISAVIECYSTFIQALYFPILTYF